MANGFLSDGKGDSSSGRLIGFLVVLQLILGLMHLMMLSILVQPEHVQLL